MRITTVIVLTLTLCILNSGCNSEPDSPSGHEHFQLAEKYKSGEGVTQDHKEAEKWYRLAAEQGHAEAQFSLGQMYSFGKGVPSDDTEAAKWYRLAAEQGHAGAQNNLGIKYAFGLVGNPDYKEAYIWCYISNTNEPNNLTKENVEGFKAKLSPEQLAEAQEEATARFKQIEARQQ